MWTPLHAGLGGKDPPKIDVAPKNGLTAELEEMLASLTWLDRVLLRIGIRWLRKIAVTVIGLTLVLIGIAMIVTPGPATVVIPIGLAVLGLEYAWARRLLRRLRRYVDAGITQGSAWLGFGKPPPASGAAPPCVGESPDSRQSHHRPTSIST
ncbi:MAG: PGPGW domain-containing protein [Thermogutta sp.]